MFLSSQWSRFSGLGSSEGGAGGKGVQSETRVIAGQPSITDEAELCQRTGPRGKRVERVQGNR